jgi:hypothetical protein
MDTLPQRPGVHNSFMKPRACRRAPGPAAGAISTRRDHASFHVFIAQVNALATGLTLVNDNNSACNEIQLLDPGSSATTGGNSNAWHNSTRANVRFTSTW